jgi:hypothetical protein
MQEDKSAREGGQSEKFNPLKFDVLMEMNVRLSSAGM